MADLFNPDSMQVYGEVTCNSQCSECQDAPHHWMDESIDTDDQDAVDEFSKERPLLLMSKSLLIAHYRCKHCPAVRRWDGKFSC